MCQENSDKWVDTLKKSPIFNMSLSSKELFHSNFIAWVLENYPKEMGSFFSVFLGIEDIGIKEYTIKREEKNIDLSFQLGDITVYIENKVKSIAYKKQLDKYSGYDIIQNNSKKTKCIILSLKKPTFLDENSCYITKKENIQTCIEKDITWHYVSYDALIKHLSEKIITLPLNKEHTQYNKLLLEDYVQFIKILDECIVPEILKTNIVNLHTKGTDANDMLIKLTKLRMHDFFQKGIFEDLVIKVEKELKDKSISITSNMTHAQGQLHISIKYDDNIKMGIQIQGGLYKKFIEGTEQKNIHEKAKELDEESFFKVKEIELKFKRGGKDMKLDDKLDINEGDLKFNKYHTPSKKHLFLYKKIALKELKVQDNDALVTIICNDVEDILKRFIAKG